MRILFFILFFASIMLCDLRANNDAPQAEASLLPVKEKVVFDRLDVERIERKKEHYRRELEQARKFQRAGYVVGGVVTTIVGCYVGYLLWNYFSSHAEQSQSEASLDKGISYHQLHAEYLRQWKEDYTFGGLIKNQLKNGFSLAITSVIIGAAGALISKTFNQKIDQIKQLFNKDSAALFFVTHTKAMKNMHKMGDSLFDFINSLRAMTHADGKIDEAFEDYFYADLKIGYEAFVRSIEDFIAVALENLEQERVADSENFNQKRVQEIEREIMRISSLVNDIGLYFEFVANGVGSYVQKDMYMKSRAYMKKISVQMTRFTDSLGGVLYGEKFSVL